MRSSDISASAHPTGQPLIGCAESIDLFRLKVRRNPNRLILDGTGSHFWRRGERPRSGIGR